MRVNSYSSCQNNTGFTALYINPAKIEQVVGKRFAKHAVDAIPRLEELAKDVNIEVLPCVNLFHPEDLRHFGFKYVISKILPEKPKIKNPVKSFFVNLFKQKELPPKLEDKIIFNSIPDDKNVADYLIESVSRLKNKFIKLGGLD